MSVYTEGKEKAPAEQTRIDEIEEAARVRLRHSPYRALRAITCRLDGDGVLHLCGSVPTYHHKQLAQTAVVGMDGLRQVVNEIDVDSTP